MTETAAGWLQTEAPGIWPIIGILSYCLTMNELPSRRDAQVRDRRGSVDAVGNRAKGKRS
jgi:hypothetical protein